MLDKFKDECGVFGIFGNPEAANLTYLGLRALQHRGQESAGIATADGEKMRIARAMVSGEPPGVSGTMIRTARSGKPCPHPRQGKSAAQTRTNHRFIDRDSPGFAPPVYLLDTSA